jgi:hypothetical protein
VPCGFGLQGEGDRKLSGRAITFPFPGENIVGEPGGRSAVYAGISSVKV